MQSLGHGQSAGFAIDHAVLSEFDPVLEVDIGTDKAGEGAMDLMIAYLSATGLIKTGSAR